MGYPQPSATLAGAVPPVELMSMVLEQSQEKLAAIETQVNEVIDRLFNVHRVDNGKPSTAPDGVHAASERVLDVRSRAMRINEALATVLAKL